VVTVVDFADALLALPEFHSADNTQLWLAARTNAIPPVDTQCTLILRPAAKRIERIMLDRSGRLTVAGKVVTKTQLRARLIKELNAGRRPSIELGIETDVSSELLDRTLRWLQDVGVQLGHIRVVGNKSRPGRGRNEP
jgi:hypothetical protein